MMESVRGMHAGITHRYRYILLYMWYNREVQTMTFNPLAAPCRTIIDILQLLAGILTVDNTTQTVLYGLRE